MKKKHLCVVLIALSLGLFSIPVSAKKQVKIATIGAVSPLLDVSLTYQQKVDAMNDFLGGQIAQVLPDKPDLIVLPEACDRPRGMSVKQQYEYYRIRGNQIQNYLSEIASKYNCYIAFGIKKEIWEQSHYT